MKNRIIFEKWNTCKQYSYIWHHRAALSWGTY